MIEQINKLIRERQKTTWLLGRSISLQQSADLNVIFVVDDRIYSDLSQIDDAAVRQLIQESVDDWQSEQEIGQTAQTDRPLDAADSGALDPAREVKLDDWNRKANWLVALLPLILAVLLLRLNPGYVMQLLLRQPPYIIYPTLPCGWVVVAFTIFLMFTGRVVFRLIDTLPYRRWSLIVLKGIVFALFIIPAIFMIVLGPAVFTVIRTNPLG